jgi:hypothetical protein
MNRRPKEGRFQPSRCLLVNQREAHLLSSKLVLVVKFNSLSTHFLSELGLEWDSERRSQWYSME